MLGTHLGVAPVCERVARELIVDGRNNAGVMGYMSRDEALFDLLENGDSRHKFCLLVKKSCKDGKENRRRLELISS